MKRKTLSLKFCGLYAIDSKVECFYYKYVEESNLLYKLADSSVKIIYKKTLEFPSKFQSSLGDQLRRSSLSIVLNIVEAGARNSVKERRALLNYAYGSLKETKYLLYFRNELGLINDLEGEQLLGRLAGLLYGILYKK